MLALYQNNGAWGTHTTFVVCGQLARCLNCSGEMEKPHSLWRMIVFTTFVVCAAPTPCLPIEGKGDRLRWMRCFNPRPNRGISLCRRQNIAFVRTYRAPSGAYHNAVILLSLLFGTAKRSRRISYPQARKRDSSLRIRSIQNDSIRHAYNICCMRRPHPLPSH